jgi:hypothetical protein
MPKRPPEVLLRRAAYNREYRKTHKDMRKRPYKVRTDRGYVEYHLAFQMVRSRLLAILSRDYPDFHQRLRDQAILELLEERDA